MLRLLCALTAVGVVSGFALLLVTGEYANDGPVIVRVVGGEHGVHVGDLFVLAGWAVAVLAVLGLAVLPARRPDADRGHRRDDAERPTRHSGGEMAECQE